MMRQIALSVAVAALVTVCSVPVNGQDACVMPNAIDPEQAVLMFDSFLNKGCFGQESPTGDVFCFGFEPTCDDGAAACPPSICQRIALWATCWDIGIECNASTCGDAFCAERGEMTRGEVQTALVRASAPLFAEVRELAGTLPDTQDTQRLEEQLRAWEALLAEGDPARLPTGEWDRQGLVLFSSDETEVGGGPAEREIDTEHLLESACSDPPDTCLSTFNRLGSVWTLALSQKTLLRALQRQNRNATLRYLRVLDRRWRAYLLGGRSLYPWERWINGEIYRRSLDDQRGFIEPPSRQFVLFHPAAAYEYREFAEDGLEEVLTLEVVGFYRWRWSADSEISKPWGGSLLLSWDGSEEDSVGYGVMAHMPRNWSLGLVVRQDADDDEVALLLAADLSKLFVKTAKFRDKLRQLRFAED